MYYKSQTWLTGQKWNNAIAFENRKKLGSSLRLSIPEAINWDLSDITIQENSDYVWFEEVENQYEKNKPALQKKLGLEKLVTMERFWKRISIIDNHNHAFYFWAKALIEWDIQASFDLIHVDQHSDLWVPLSHFDSVKLNNLDSVAKYTNEVLEVWNFIRAAQECHLIAHDIQIRSEYALLNFEIKKYDAAWIEGKHVNYVLDIDLDFWTSEMWIVSV